MSLNSSAKNVDTYWVYKNRNREKKRELNITASISNRGSRGEEALGESGECQKEKPMSAKSRAK